MNLSVWIKRNILLMDVLIVPEIEKKSAAATEKLNGAVVDLTLKVDAMNALLDDAVRSVGHRSRRK